MKQWRCIEFKSLIQKLIHSNHTRVHKLPYVKGDWQTDSETDRQADWQTDRQTDKLNPISLRFTGDNKCFLIIFLAGDFMSYVDQFGDFMSGDFMSGDFLTWIRVTCIHEVSCRLNEQFYIGAFRQDLFQCTTKASPSDPFLG